MAERTGPGKTPPAPPSRRWLVGFDTAQLQEERCGVLVVGSGIAGLVAALEADAAGHDVALMTKARVAETGTWYAQGGIAGAVGEADSVELHLADTLVVGQGLCEEPVVRAVVGEAAEALRHLRGLGVSFDLAEGGGVALAREGGHSLPRVLHSGDATGQAVQEALSARVRAASGIRTFEEHFLVDLLTADGACAGALAHDARRGLVAFRAGAVVLATGGCGQMYRVTTNPAIATGDGVAAAWRAGAEVADLEFVQFHPTALDHEANPKSLITEALRGEGAYLLDCDERRFMADVHPLAELAPRDVVSREIEAVMQRCRRPNVWLDARHLGREFLQRRFPTIWERCAEAGFDLASDLVPVAPAAHYLIGGVLVDLDGRTSISGLYASGECVASGLHGANRLASNSLLEGLVLSRRLVRALDAGPPALARVVGEAAAPSATAPTDVRAEVRTLMSANVGMRRTEKGLVQASRGLARLDAGLAPDGVEGFERANLVTVASLVATGARLRTESRGTHARVDHPQRDDESWRAHLVQRLGADPRLAPVGAFAPAGI